MPTELRRKDVKSLVQQGRAQLVEVLPAKEYRREHLPKSINIPLSDLNPETAQQLRKDQAIIVYCADYRCDVSARAAWRLESMGFQEVYRYTAGKADWLSAGFDTEGIQARKPRLKQILKRAVLTCAPKDRVGVIKNRRPQPTDVCVVVNDRGVVLGMIEGEAWDQDPLKTAAEVMNPAPRTFRPDSDPTDVMKDMKKEDIENALVTTSDGELLGFIRREKKAKKAA
jgi:rhodanese-related sulfurtransferase/CBS domain-containing protein